jgi:hypothetical protein
VSKGEVLLEDERDPLRKWTRPAAVRNAHGVTEKHVSISSEERALVAFHHAPVTLPRIRFVMPVRLLLTTMRNLGGGTTTEGPASAGLFSAHRFSHEVNLRKRRKLLVMGHPLRFGTHFFLTGF